MKTVLGKEVITVKKMLNPIEIVIYDDIKTERERQVQLWGEQSETPWGWLSILVEEVGEVAKEVNEHDYLEGPSKNMEDELIQVAAVAIAWLGDIRRSKSD